MIPSPKKLNIQKQTDFDIAVIGGGIVGLASAYKIQMRYPGTRIGVFEKEDKLAMHQTGHNSGVIHSGLYYKSCSYKAKNCIRGRKELIDFAAEHGIACDICGKIIVATDEVELTALEKVFQNGLENEIGGIEKIGPEQISEIEPFCQGIAGIYVPCTGIIDFKEVAKKLAELLKSKSQENSVMTGCEVTAIDKHGGIARITTSRGNFTAEYLINCAGLQCDRIAKMDGVNPVIKIIPFRGDYYELTEGALRKVRNLIYPVPDPTFPFLGVHFTRMITGVVGTVGGYSYSTTVLQPLLSKNETVSKMVGFIMSELDQYEYYESLDNSLAYFHLGEASHPLMDWTCPQHDLQLWAGTLPEWVPHIKDIRMSDAEVRETADFTKRSLSQLIQIHDALSGYSW